jgi:hypothetical protein
VNLGEERSLGEEPWRGAEPWRGTLERSLGEEPWSAAPRALNQDAQNLFIINLSNARTSVGMLAGVREGKHINIRLYDALKSKVKIRHHINGCLYVRLKSRSLI